MNLQFTPWPSVPEISQATHNLIGLHVLEAQRDDVVVVLLRPMEGDLVARGPRAEVMARPNLRSVLESRPDDDGIPVIAWRPSDGWGRCFTAAVPSKGDA